VSHILQTFNLSKNYGKKTALQGLHMNVRPGTIYGFLGVNGAGKTTTFSILGRFIKPTSGSFEVKGKLSILPQDARFYPGRKIASQLDFFARLSGVRASEVRSEITRVLKLVGLLEKANVAAEKISHGMFKRLGIAQALLGNPDILLLDEPTAGLDPETAYETRKMIKDLAKEKTIVISSHNLGEIAEMCEDVGIIHEGKMQFEGPTKDITRQTSSINIYLTGKFDLNLLNQFSWILEKKFDQEKNVLHLSFDEEQIHLEAVNELLLPVLLKAGVGIRQIIQGKSLEASFLELVKGDQNK
jgi:ABC-2 type transport system ATP-binding protein